MILSEPIHLETDVLVIGAGGAGMYAAIEAARAGQRVLLADRSLIGRGGATVMAMMTVAAARALIGAPGLVIADEPTSALDHNARDRFISLLSEEATRASAALLFVSHDETLADQFDQAISLADINRANATVEV